LQANTGALRWAYTYPSKFPNSGDSWGGWWDYGAQNQSVFGPNGPHLGGGELYIKGMKSSRLVALRPDGSVVDWKRSVPDNSMMAGSDDQRIYLAGEESLAYSLKTRELLWANSLPAGTSGIQPLLTQNRYYQFTPRGIYELDKTTGDVMRLIRGADRDCQGGAILATPKLLITISDRAITAYPLKESTEVAKRDQDSTTPPGGKPE
jgi:outer membrane protein assembly factor BamB